jgi:hypothetical protein
LNKFFLLGIIPLLLLIPHNTFGWGPVWGPSPGQEGSPYYHQLGWGDGAHSYENGYYAGQQDAIYDHDNNLVYNPVGQCLVSLFL